MDHFLKNSEGKKVLVPGLKTQTKNTSSAESDIQNLNRRLVDSEKSVSELRIEVSAIRQALKRSAKNSALVFAMLIASIVTLACVLAFVLHLK